MDNNKNTFRLILALAVIVGFFLPWFHPGGSGWDIVRLGGGYNDAKSQIIRYSFLLPPIFALIVLVRSVNKQSTGFLTRALPFIVIAILSALYVLGVKTTYGSAEASSFFSILAIGYYMTAIGSFLLMLV